MHIHGREIIEQFHFSFPNNVIILFLNANNDYRNTLHSTRNKSMSPPQENFLKLVDQHKHILYKVANSYCRESDDRPDLIQEILIQLYLSFEKFDGRVKFSTWMYRIALNVAISFYRSDRQYFKNTTLIDDFVTGLGFVDKSLSETGDELRLLYQAINNLDEMNRALILLYMDGYKYAEIADLTGVSETNVSTRISRIKSKFQKDLETIHPTQIKGSKQ